MSENFDEVLFPTDIALGSLTGPRRKTEIVNLASGYEQRNTRWKHSRRMYNAGYGMKHIADLYRVVEFFEERRGRLQGFRFRDPLDHKSSSPDLLVSHFDQTIGTGDGVQSKFPLCKSYGTGASPYLRRIHKPVASTVVISVDAVIQNADVHYQVDPVIGEITFLPGSIPELGNQITAGFVFDVPVRFDTDEISVNLEAFESGQIPSIPLIEILL